MDFSINSSLSALSSSVLIHILHPFDLLKTSFQSKNINKDNERFT